MQKNKTKINSGYGDHHNSLKGQTVMAAPIRKENTSKTSQNKTYIHRIETTVDRHLQRKDPEHILSLLGKKCAEMSGFSSRILISESGLGRFARLRATTICKIVWRRYS